ncbi:hypothetical protein [Rathayibacter sp. AY1G1]|uniref:hypothetical protein n=1 Tax=Rathayibacter sp. AY1G1 TaxID=2080564 RepID=UPI0015E2B473|nr:hypothetical protein [Rathayibacter sp. AY1G1]
MNVDDSSTPSASEQPSREPNEAPRKRPLSPKEQYLEQTIAEDYAGLGDGARRELFED